MATFKVRYSGEPSIGLPTIYCKTYEDFKRVYKLAYEESNKDPYKDWDMSKELMLSSTERYGHWKGVLFQNTRG